MVDAAEKLGNRIRKAKGEKLPYVLVVGDDDVEAGTVGVNPRGGEVERGVHARRVRRAAGRRGLATSRRPVRDAHPQRGGHGGGPSAGLAQLWAGWRRATSTASPPTTPRSAPDDAGRSLFERILGAACPTTRPSSSTGERPAAVLLNAYPYGSGHLLVLPNRAVPDLEDLAPTRRAELWAGRHRRGGHNARRYRPTGSTSGSTSVPPPGRRARPPPRPLPAPLGRRHQLHDRGGRDPGAARAAGRHLAQAARRLAGLTARVGSVGACAATVDVTEPDDGPTVATSRPMTSSPTPRSRDELPEDLDVSGFVGPYVFPNNNRRRIPGYLYLGSRRSACWCGSCAATTATPRSTTGSSGPPASLVAVGAYCLVAGLDLDVDERDALVAATEQVGFPVGHASAQMGWRGLRSRPTWRILLYSAENPPERRAWCWSTASTARSRVVRRGQPRGLERARRRPTAPANPSPPAGSHDPGSGPGPVGRRTVARRARGRPGSTDG